MVEQIIMAVLSASLLSGTLVRRKRTPRPFLYIIALVLSIAALVLPLLYPVTTPVFYFVLAVSLGLNVVIAILEFTAGRSGMKREDQPE